MKLPTFVCLAGTMLFAACGGGGGSGSSAQPAAASAPGSAGVSGQAGAGVSTQAVSGTLLVGNPGSTAMSTGRSPAFVYSGQSRLIEGATFHRSSICLNFCVALLLFDI
jgi:hypothetical protein